MLITNCSKWSFLVPILILAGLLTACGGGGTAVSAVEDPSLTAAEWQLVSLNDKPVDEGRLATLAFGELNNAIGSTGCNLYSATYSIGTGNVLNISPSVSTSFDCPEPFLAQEQAMLLVLSSTSNYVIEGDELKITNPDDERRGAFKKMEPLELEGTDWYLDAYNDGQGAFVNLIDNTEITAVFETDSNLAGSGGCNDYNTTYQVDGRDITIGPIMSTQKACAQPEGVMEQEGLYLQALESAAGFRNFGVILNLFNAEGDILATYFQGDIVRSR
jgi:heat shock protein HslJ